MSNLIVIFTESNDPHCTNNIEKGISCWNKTDKIDLEPGTYYYRDVYTNFYNSYSLDNGSYFVGYPYVLGEKKFYKLVLGLESNYCVSCGVDMGPSNPRQYCRKTYCPYDKN
jgi:hypothetical protein